ncbi:hypothetical protein [Streptosporangium sp. NPDC002721]|uniref:DUF7927 domain-containing protein n=1 Tax=Streptosporangium sp. NPDC002721 TaxID=3366188 RepID=UPI0036BAE97F
MPVPAEGEGPSPASVTGKRVVRAASGGEGRAAAGAGKPEVEITKTAWPVLAKPGQKVAYTVELRNTGGSGRRGFTFTDDLSGLLDDARFDHDQWATSGTVSFTAPKVTWTGDVAAGQTVKVTYGVTVDDPPAGDLRLSGELVGPEGSNCAVGSADPACGNLGAPGLPLLYVLMTADRETAGPGQAVAYTITVGNVGNAAYQGARLTGELSRVLDDATYNGDARATSGTVSYGAPKLAWNGDIPTGETVTITYSVTVGTSGAGDGMLDSAVQAPGGGTNCPDPVPWSARRAAPVPDAGFGCAQRVAIRGTTTTGPVGPRVSGSGSGSESGSESGSGSGFESGSGSGDAAVGVAPGAGCPAGSTGPGCGTGPAGNASAPVPGSDSSPGPGSAPDSNSNSGAGSGSGSNPNSGSAQTSAPGSNSGSGPDSGPGSDSGSNPNPNSGAGPAQASASASGAVSGPDAVPMPAPGSVPDPDAVPVPGALPVPGRVPVSPSGPAPVSGPETALAPARVPEPPVAPSCGPGGRGRSFAVPCPEDGPRKGPAGPSLPFTGLPFWPVLVGLLLFGLGLALRWRTREGRP